MMTPGVSFQPGSADATDANQARRTSGSQQGVQEAIKVLSLRLPKVVGAQASAPAPLLSAQGSGGRHVDSIVESVLQKYFPTGGASAAPAPMIPEGGPASAPATAPQFGGTSGTAGLRRESPSVDNLGQLSPTPRVVVTLPPGLPAGDFTVGDDGRPKGTNPGGGIFEDAPDLRKHFDWMQPPFGGGAGRDEPPAI